MNTTPHLITMQINEHGGGRVLLDGKELHTTKLVVVSEAGQPPQVELTIVAAVDGTVDIANLSLEVKAGDQLEVSG